jgi:hypothetical protein
VTCMLPQTRDLREGDLVTWIYLKGRPLKEVIVREGVVDSVGDSFCGVISGGKLFYLSDADGVRPAAVPSEVASWEGADDVEERLFQRLLTPAKPVVVRDFAPLLDDQGDLL